MKVLRLVVFGQLTLGTAAAHAAEIGHFAPGVPNIRDFAMPEQGFYGVLYNYYYTTDRLNDADGNEIDSITINPGPGPGITLTGPGRGRGCLCVRAHADLGFAL